MTAVDDCAAARHRRSETTRGSHENPARPAERRVDVAGDELHEGLVLLDQELRIGDMRNRDAVARVLARQKPAWPPGTLLQPGESLPIQHRQRVGEEMPKPATFPPKSSGYGPQQHYLPTRRARRQSGRVLCPEAPYLAAVPSGSSLMACELRCVSMEGRREV
jgi:hypothetical protein